MRRLLQGAKILLLLALLLIVGALALLQLPSVATWTGRKLVTLAPLSPGYQIDIGRVTGGWLAGLRLSDVRLVHQSRTIARIDRLQVEYSLPALLGSETRLQSLVVDSAVIAARRTNGSWNILEAFDTGQPDDTAGGGGAFRVNRLLLEDVQVEARLSPDSVLGVRDLELRATDVVLGEQVLLDLDTLHATVLPPTTQPLPIRLAANGRVTGEVLHLDSLSIQSPRSRVAGRFTLPRDFDDSALADRLAGSLEAEPLALADVAVFFPQVVPDGNLNLQADISADGKLAHAGLTARLENSSIQLKGSTLLGGEAPVHYRVESELRDVDPAELLRTAPQGSLTGSLALSLEGPRLDSANGSALLRLTRSSLSGTRVPALLLAAEVKKGRAEVDVRGQVGEARVRADGWVRPFDSLPLYQLAGLARDIPGTDAVARALADRGDGAKLGVRFRLSGKGVSPEQAEVSGRVQLLGLRDAGEPEALGNITISLDNGRLRARPLLQVAGGRVSGLLVATLGDTIRYRVRGGIIEEVELGQLLEDTLAAPVSGRFTLEGRGIDPEQAVASGRLELDQLEYGGRQMSDVSARVRLRRGRAGVVIAGEAQGGTLALQATVRPFATPLTFSIDSASVREVDLGSWLGRPDLSGPVTLHASGGGRWGENIRRVKGTVELRPSRLGEIDLAGGTVSATLEGGHLTYDAALQTSSGSLALAGEGYPLDSVPSFGVRSGTVDSLDLGTLLGRPGLATALDARFTGSAKGTTLDSMLARLDLDLERSEVNRARIGPGEASLQLAGGKLDGTIRLEGPDADLSADLSGRLAGERQHLAARGTVRLEQLDRWTGDSTRDGRLEGKFDLQAALDTAGLVNASGTVTAIGGLGRVRLQMLHAVLAPDTGAIVFDTLLVRSNVAVLTGGGRLPLRDTGAAGDTLELTGRIGDVSALAELVGIDSVTLDSARFDVAVTGPPAQRRVSGDGFAHRLLYSSTLVEELEARATATLDSTGLGGVSGRVQVNGLATGGVIVHEAQFAGRYDSLISLEGRAEFGEGVRLNLTLQGESAGDTTSLLLRQIQLAEGGRRWSLSRPARIALGPESVRVDDFSLATGGSRIVLDGLLALSDSSDLTLRLDSVELGDLERSGLVPVPGMLDGVLQLKGPATSPLLSGNLGLTLHEGTEESLGHVETAIEWTRRGLQMNLVAAHEEGGRLVTQGTLPWGFTLAPEDTTQTFAVVREPGDTINLQMEADSFEVALLRPFVPDEVVRRLEGNLAIETRIRGTPERPLARGSFQLSGLALHLPALDVTYRRGRLIGSLEGETLYLDSLLLRSGENEELAVQGRVQLRPLNNPSLDLTAELRDFVVSSSAQLEAQASGQIRLGGNFETPVVTGSLRLDRAEYFVTGPSGLAVSDVELTEEDRRELAQNFGPAVLDRIAEDGGFLDRFRLDLDLRLPSQVWFRRQEAPELNVEVAGRIQLRQEPGGDMQFYGTVEPVPGRSSLDVYGRSFELAGGEIVLNGPVDETVIDVTAEYHVPTQGAADNEGVTVNVAARGRPDSIALQLGSDPEMPEDDIVSYVVTGRPSSDNPLVQRSGEEGGTGGKEIALGQLTEAISGAVGQELGFDVFQIRQDGTSGLTLTAGRYLTPEFYISLQQPLELSGQDPQAAGTNLGPGFELQYRVHPWLRLLLQGGSLPSGVLLRGRYAY